jgi:hypothetical protein
MLEMIVVSIAKLPHWLGLVAEVMLVTILFTFAIIFLWGMWLGISIVGRRANDIESITLIPLEIKFRERQ